MFGHPEAQAPITNDLEIEESLLNSSLGTQLYSKLTENSGNDVSGTTSNEILLSMWEQLVGAGRLTDGSGDDVSGNAPDDSGYVSFPYKTNDRISFLVRIEGIATNQTGVSSVSNLSSGTTEGTEINLGSVFGNVNGVSSIGDGSSIRINSQVWKFTYKL